MHSMYRRSAQDIFYARLAVEPVYIRREVSFQQMVRQEGYDPKVTAELYALQGDKPSTYAHVQEALNVDSGSPTAIWAINTAARATAVQAAFYSGEARATRDPFEKIGNWLRARREFREAAILAREATVLNYMSETNYIPTLLKATEKK